MGNGQDRYVLAMCLRKENELPSSYGMAVNILLTACAVAAIWTAHHMHLGDSYIHFASLFYIIIYCYSLIYFILRDDTYVISSIFAWLMTFGGWTAEVRILMEKALFGGKIREDPKIRKNIRKI